MKWLADVIFNENARSLNQQRRAEAVGKLMAYDRRDAAGIRSGLVEPIAHLMRSCRGPVTLIF